MTFFPVQEFQAVVYCGQGSRLYPLTIKDTYPKALLPLTGKPMLHYPLEWLEREGIYGNQFNTDASRNILLWTRRDRRFT